MYVFAVDADSNARKNKHPVTVALTRDVNGRPSVLRTLIDACCTGRGLISEKTVKSLGLKMTKKSHGGTYTSVGGKFKSLGYVRIPALILPVLSQDQSFSVELEVVPDNNMSYSIIMGQQTMHDLQIDTKISSYEIIWNDIHRPMVDQNYWSKQRMQRMIPVWKCYLARLDTKRSDIKTQVVQNEDGGDVSSYSSCPSSSHFKSVFD